MNNWGAGTSAPVTSLVLPAYNPGPILENTWRAVEQFLGRVSESWEVLFVCDGCTDGSAERLRDWSAGHAGQVRVLSYAPNRGKGHAVRCGLAAARGQWRLFTDVDLAYGFDDVERVAETLRRGAALAIASRQHQGSRVVIPSRLFGYAYRRQLQSLAFASLVRLLLPLKHRDTQAGLKGMDANAARMLLPALTCNGFGFDCELLTAAAHFGLPVAEVPVCVRFEDHASTTSMATLGRMIRELLLIRNKWRGRSVQALVAPIVSNRRAA
jgi:dolichyl-phosphate beta-glucosyltransferase